MQKVYNGGFFKVSDGGKISGAAFCHKSAELLIIHELLTNSEEAAITDALGDFWKADRAVGVKAAKGGDKFAVIYPLGYRDVYFGLGMQ